MHLKETELYEIQGGGISINATLINAFARAISTILDLGRTFSRTCRI